MGNAAKVVTDGYYGSPFDYTDLGNGTFLDNNTGLEWEIKDNNGELHDVNSLYTTSNEDIWNIDGSVLQYLDKVNNEEKLGGHSDWRIPTVSELVTLLDYSKYNLAVPTSLPGLTSPANHLTSDYNAFKSVGLGGAWTVSFIGGMTFCDSHFRPRAVRVVRGAKAPAFSYCDNGDGTATDKNTGLVWELKDASGGIHDMDAEFSWSKTPGKPDGTIFTEFLAQLNKEKLGGYDDWRIPTAKEIQTSQDMSEFDPTNPWIPGRTPGSYYWSSTMFCGPFENPGPWLVDISFGDIYPHLSLVPRRARAVRG